MYVFETSGPMAAACLRPVQTRVHATQKRAKHPKTKYPHYDHCQQRFRTIFRQVLYLITGSNQGANKTGDDHDLIDQDGIENGGPWQTSSQEDVHE